MSIALVLAGHGSQISPNTAGLVWQYVDKLRTWGVADEITACFWKEQPHFNQVLDTLASETIVVVPVFTAAGFFSNQVIPAEMNLSGTLTECDGRKIYYTRTLGEHPYLQMIVRQQVERTIQDASLSAHNVAVAIIGHGTSRSASTRQTTEAQVQALQHASIVSEVVSAYLDDEPSIPSIYERTQASNIIGVPFFLAAGSHASQDVPEALGIAFGQFPAQVNERQVYYCEPVGTDEAICDLIVELASETGLPFERKPQQKEWVNFPRKGASTLRDRVVRDGELKFGELHLTPTTIQPINTSAEVSIHTSSMLRQHIRENPFRPLATSNDLKHDWIIHIDSTATLAPIVETIYPGAVQDWSAQQNNTFVAETLETVIARQQGMFAKIDRGEDAKIAHFVSSVCGRCIKIPMWYHQTTVPDAVPCASPCNFWLTQIMEEN